MSKGDKLKYIIIIISIVLTLTGVVIFGVLKNNDNLDKTTVVKLNGEISKTLKAEVKGLYPGKTEEYKILLEGSDAEEFFITLKFFGDDGGKLKDHVDVGIVTDNVSVEKPLSELLDGELISLGQGLTEIKILYTMPIDTGDEIQGESVSFKIELNAKYVKQ